MERRCWGVLLLWMIVGQGPIALAIGAGGGLFGHFFSHLSFLFSFSLSLGDGPIYPKQPTNQPSILQNRIAIDIFTALGLKT